MEWKRLVEDLHKENERNTRQIAGMVRRDQIPKDCLARLGPKVDSRLYAPSQAEDEEGELATRKGEEAEADAEEKDGQPCPEVDPKDAELAGRFRALQAETGYHVMASVDADPVIDTFLSHMVPFEKEEVSAAVCPGCMRAFNWRGLKGKVSVVWTGRWCQAARSYSHRTNQPNSSRRRRCWWETWWATART